MLLLFLCCCSFWFLFFVVFSVTVCCEYYLWIAAVALPFTLEPQPSLLLFRFLLLLVKASASAPLDRVVLIYLRFGGYSVCALFHIVRYAGPPH